MADTDPKEALRVLNAWTRSSLGYADFDTFIRAGGSFGDAITAIGNERRRLGLAMVALYQWKPAPPPHPPEVAGQGEAEDYERANERITIGPEALARAEAEVTGEPVDPHNAGIQGLDR